MSDKYRIDEDEFTLAVMAIHKSRHPDSKRYVEAGYSCINFYDEDGELELMLATPYLYDAEYYSTSLKILETGSGDFE